MPHVNKKPQKMEIWFKQKIGSEWIMNGFGKPFRKKILSKKSKKQ